MAPDNNPCFRVLNTTARAVMTIYQSPKFGALAMPHHLINNIAASSPSVVEVTYPDMTIKVIGRNLSTLLGLFVQQRIAAISVIDERTSPLGEDLACVDAIEIVRPTGR